MKSFVFFALVMLASGLNASERVDWEFYVERGLAQVRATSASDLRPAEKRAMEEICDLFADFAIGNVNFDSAMLDEAILKQYPFLRSNRRGAIFSHAFLLHESPIKKTVRHSIPINLGSSYDPRYFSIDWFDTGVHCQYCPQSEKRDLEFLLQLAYGYLHRTYGEIFPQASETVWFDLYSSGESWVKDWYGTDPFSMLRRKLTPNFATFYAQNHRPKTIRQIHRTLQRSKLHQDVVFFKTLAQMLVLEPVWNEKLPVASDPITPVMVPAVWLVFFDELFEVNRKEKFYYLSIPKNQRLTNEVAMMQLMRELWKKSDGTLHTDLLPRILERSPKNFKDLARAYDRIMGKKIGRGDLWYRQNFE